MTKITDKEYIERGGGICPFCQSEDITGGSFYMEGLIVILNVYCNVCEKQWYDTFTLMGYDEK